jgi:hypothetical protein
MGPILRTSAQSCRLLSVMCSRRSVGQGTVEADTVVYSLRHRNSSSSLAGREQHRPLYIDQPGPHDR